MKKRVTPEVVLMAVALPRKRKGLLIVLVLLLLLGVGALCGYMYWASPVSYTHLTLTTILLV